MSASASKDTESKKTAKKPQKTVVLEENEETSKKINTKEMIHEALTASKSRKGLSLYAIKKYIYEKFQTDPKKIDYIIKKHLKTGVENGTIVQTKGIGASGSFKLPPGKKLTAKKKPAAAENPSGKSDDKPVKSKKSTAVTDGKSKPSKIASAKSSEKGKATTKKPKGKLDDVRSDKIMKTPSKNRAKMMKRKSIGSIIKPPKMKPKAVAR